MRICRKPLFYILFAALWVFAGAGATAMAAQSPQIPIAGKTIPKYVNQLPLLTCICTGRHHANGFWKRAAYAPHVRVQSPSSAPRRGGIAG